jgi:RNA polymerase sigma-70 factor (ECF subfamily)
MEIRLFRRGAPMPEPQTDTAALVERLPSGGDAARSALIARTCDRLRALARQMLWEYDVVARWEQTDDVLQNALVRLCRALEAAPPESVRHFYRLAELQLRRELLDLADRYRGANGVGANHHTDPTGGAVGGHPDPVDGPQTLAEWTEFHNLVERLSEQEREVFGLLWYQQLSLEEAAEVLGVSVRTVKRMWQAARISLARLCAGEAPG